MVAISVRKVIVKDQRIVRSSELQPIYTCTCREREIEFNIQAWNMRGRHIQLVLFGLENFGYVISSILCASNVSIPIVWFLHLQLPELNCKMNSVVASHNPD
jgi:hypothetical protein